MLAGCFSLIDQNPGIGLLRANIPKRQFSAEFGVINRWGKIGYPGKRHSSKFTRASPEYRTLKDKSFFMKKIIIGVVLAGSLTAAVAASLNTKNHKKDAAKTEYKCEKKKSSCGHSCPFSMGI